jgi:cobalt/nickel transport system permease protein
MLTEQSAYSNRWRQVTPLAKGCFALSGLLAASAAGSARTALVVAALMAITTLLGAGVAPLRYLRIAAPALVFLATSGISLAVSLDFGSAATGISLHATQPELSRIALICSRSLACLTALLFLALTTPLPDIIAVLRTCKVPDTLLDLMILCYRTLFVLSETIHETRTAQAARLGHSTMALSLRSLGSLVTNLTVQVWQRSLALHYAALARNNDGALRFLENSHPHTRRHVAVAATAGSLVIILAVLL